MPTLKGTEALLCYVQCFLYQVSSSINVSILHSTWLDTLWTDQFFIYVYSQIFCQLKIFKEDARMLVRLEHHIFTRFPMWLVSNSLSHKEF